MNEKVSQYKNMFTQYWKPQSKQRKGIIIGAFLFLIVTLSLFVYFVSKPQLIPLYANAMTQKEIGGIKAELERQGYTNFQLSGDGSIILVPKEDAPDLLVNLAAKGLPKTGAISFSDITKGNSFGITERQFDALEREAIGSQLSYLIERIDGVENAEVMITMPQENVFVRLEDKEKASASILLELQPGYELDQSQITALHHLVSKSIPSLPKENIAITDQYGQLLAFAEEKNNGASVVESYDDQQRIKRSVETDIQRELQKMLGTIMGHDKVLIHAFVQLNFDKVRTQENLVEPIDKEMNEGVAISVEKIAKSYNGLAPNEGGIDGVGETDIPSYQENDTQAGNEFEESQNRINYEVNRITRDIIKSPYTIEDITINVGVEPPIPNDPLSLTPMIEENIQKVIGNVVRTALSEEKTLTDDEITKRISVFPHAFEGKETMPIVTSKEEKAFYETFVFYGLIVLVVILVIVLMILVMRAKKPSKQQEEFFDLSAAKPVNQFEFDENTDHIKNELETLAKDQTQDFIDVLRHWLSYEDKER